MALYAQTGALTATYEYDAWGKMVSVKNASGAEITDQNHVANVNPLRYRGYYYDAESGLYYLMSRYYDPEVKRFINADNIGGQVGELGSHNIFSYCQNNPVINYDPTGHFLETIFAGLAAATAAAAAATAVATVGLAVVGTVLVVQVAEATKVNVRDTRTAQYVRNRYREQSKPQTIAQAPPKQKPNSGRKYYRAEATYPGAKVYKYAPMDEKIAATVLTVGGDIYAETEQDAIYLCKTYGAGFSGPTNDSNPKNAMHYHFGVYENRAHIFFGYDPNLIFVTSME